VQWTDSRSFIGMHGLCRATTLLMRNDCERLLFPEVFLRLKRAGQDLRLPQ
jgi:hypothetical protein